MKEELINWFCNKGLNKEDVLEKTKENYMELGFIDSLGFLEMISFCEETFNISFEDEDFENDAIFTIDGLVEIITRKAK